MLIWCESYCTVYNGLLLIFFIICRKLVRKMDQYGDRLPNGTYTGALGDILTGRIDFCFVGFFMKYYQTPDIIFAPTIFNDRLCIFVPKAKRIPGWMILSKCFPPILWVYVTAVLVSSAILYTCFQYRNVGGDSDKTRVG